jgi:hypothetical protein
MFKEASCSPSIQSLFKANVELSPWILEEWVKEADCPDDFGNFTLIAAGKDAVLAGFSNSGTTYPDNTTNPEEMAIWISYANSNLPLELKDVNGNVCHTTEDIRSEQANAAAIYLQLTQGAFTQDDLLRIKSLPTALALAVDNSTYSLEFFKNNKNQTCFTGSGNIHTTPACIIESYVGCDGIMHVIDAWPVPVTRPLEMPGTPMTIYHLSPEKRLQGLPENTEECSRTLMDAVAERPYLQYFGAVSKLESQGGLYELLNSTNPAITMLLPTDEALREFISGIANNSDTVFNELQAIDIFKVLPDAYCLDSLLQLGQVNTAFGEYLGKENLLQFGIDNDGFATVTNVPKNRTSRILEAEVVCGSVLYVIDNHLGDPESTREEASAGHKASADELQSVLSSGNPPGNNCGFERQRTYGRFSGDAFVLPLVHAADKRDQDQSDSSSDNGNGGISTSTIAGIVIGCIAAVGLAGAAFFVVETGRKKRAPGSNGNLSALTKTHVGARIIFGGNWVGFPNPFATKPILEIWNGGLAHITISAAEAYKEVPSSLQGSQQDVSTSHSSTDHHSWNLQPVDITIENDENGKEVLLGSGAYGTVYKGRLYGLDEVAIKVIKNPELLVGTQAFRQEVEMLKRISRSPHVVQFLGMCVDGTKLMIATELMRGGDLAQALERDVQGDLNWSKSGKKIAIDITRGLCFLHANKVIHRDLKSKNVLLTENYVAKIGDLESAVAMAGGSSSLRTIEAGMAGTLHYAAPEVLLNGKCTSRIDIWSFGVVLWEMATRKRPKRGFMDLPEPSPDSPVELIQLIDDCLKTDAAERPGAREVLARLIACPPHSEVW